jgi:hypothetical protein
MLYGEVVFFLWLAVTAKIVLKRPVYDSILMPYSQKSWWEINLAVGPSIAVIPPEQNPNQVLKFI